MSKLDLPKTTIEPSNLLVELQSIATNRSLRSFADGEPVVYEFTQDPALLHQYYILRKTRYDNVFNTTDYNWGEDGYDKLSHILIARRGKLCLGGCRFTIREGDEIWTLPMENKNNAPSLRKTFPELPLNQVRHAEISRFAVMEDCGDNIFSGLCRVMYDKVISSGVYYLFVQSPYQMARNWRFVANSFGVKTTRIIDNINFIDKTISQDVKWYMVLSDLSNFCNDNVLAKNKIKKINSKISEILN